jgi:hypothetical protein
MTKAEARHRRANAIKQLRAVIREVIEVGVPQPYAQRLRKLLRESSMVCSPKFCSPRGA